MRGMTPKHDKIFPDEIEKMLKAGIVTPVSSAWSFPVVIETKKDGKIRFCVDYRILKRMMKGDRVSIQLILEIFEDLSGAVTTRFSTSLPDNGRYGCTKAARK